MKIKRYLKQVLVFCQEKENTGEIPVLNFEFPAFIINDTEFRHSVVEYVSQRVQVGMVSGNYSNKKFDKNLNYTSLMKAEDNIERQNSSKEDLAIHKYAETLMLQDMKKDIMLRSETIIENAIIMAFSKEIKLLLLKALMENTEYPYDTSSKNYENILNKLVATFYIINKKYNNTYKALQSSFLDEYMIAGKRNTEYDLITKDLIKRNNIISEQAVKELIKNNESFVFTNYPVLYENWKNNNR